MGNGTARRNIGILGGSFDPVHLGHLIMAETAREAAGLDEVWFVPAFHAPHKPEPPVAAPDQRLEMVKLAIRGNPCFRAEDIELRIGGTSYTVDTMRRLVERHPTVEFHFIVGADMAETLHTWHRAEELLQLVKFIALRRPGSDCDPQRLPEMVRRRVDVVDAPLIGISSSDIRRRVAEGKSVRYLVPDDIYDYIKENRIYVGT
jgi:nicotinate-nucleotide adenylyltransferase